MAPPLLIDFDTLRSAPVVADTAAVEAVNPHRGAMRLLDAIVFADTDTLIYGAYRDVGDDEFWVPGHIPGRPIFPGVLMLEAAAQLSSYVSLSHVKDMDFMGFAGADGIKFRGKVVPGDRFWVMVQMTELKKRRCTGTAQGVIDGQLVFEAIIKGMPI
jgi:3-hydroxyacyl-[acyl-carrier-protein] dehydratase